MHSTESSNELTAGAEAFARFLARVEEDGSADFEAFCAEHASLAPKLRRLHERWQALSGALDAIAGGSEGSPPTDPSGSTTDSAAELAARLRPAEPARYVVRGEVARGGMGAILKVFDAELRRNLAMKVLLGSERRARLDPRALARFLDEAQITAQLEHPGILPVYEMGLDPEGRVYFTMPLVRGEDLKTIIQRVGADDDAWTLPRALGVIVRVCEAVGYAHSKGVLHRDLKPSNVMVGPFGETYVMDWGLARLVGDRSGAETRPPEPGLSGEVRTVRGDEASGSPLETLVGDVVGTPVYMSPEQAQGWLDSLGPQSDVYSIGAMLYHLLTGHRPYLSPGEEPSALEVLRAVKTRAPRPLHTLAPGIPAELAAICEKAMARDPQERYAATMELADDLRAYLEHRVVHAYETGPVAEARSWIRRNSRLAAASAGLVVALAVGFAASTFFAFQSRANEKDALEQSDRADANAARLAAELRSSNIQRGRSLGRTGQVIHAENLLWREHLRDAFDPESRWGLWELYAREPVLFSQAARTEGGMRALIASPDRSVAFVSACDRTYEDGRIEVWDVGSLRVVARLEGHGNEISGLSLHPDGVVLASSSYDGTLGLWDLITHRRIASLETDGAAFNAVAFAPDGRRLVSGDAQGRLDVWDPETGEVVATVQHDDHVIALAHHPTEPVFASGTRGGSVRLWRGSDRPVATELGSTGSDVLSLAFSPDGRTLACGERDSTLTLWDVASGARLDTVATRNGALRSVAFDPSGRELYVGGWYRIDRYDRETLVRQGSFTSNIGIHGVVPDPDGRRLLSVSSGKLTVWDLDPTGCAIHLPDHRGRVVAALDDPRRRLATGDASGRVRFWDVDRGELLEEWDPLPGPVRTLALDPQERFLAVGVGAELRIHDASSRELLHAFDGLSGATEDLAAFAPDGSRLVFATEQGACEIVDPGTGARIAAVASEGTQVIGLRFHPSGESFVAVTRDYPDGPWTTRWSVSGERLSHHESRYAWKAAPSPDGATLATGSYGHEIRTWNASTGTLERTLEGHTGKVWDLAWHPEDDRLLASCDGTGAVMLWDPRAGRNLLALDLLDGPATWIRFGAEGRTLFVAGSEGEAVLLDLEYFDRHIAGNTRNQLERLREDLGGALDEPALEAWRARVLARPWPRLGSESPLRDD